MTVLTDSTARAAEFNALNPVGTPVHYWLTVRHGDPRTGRIIAPALPRGAYHSRPVVIVTGDDGDLRIVPLSLVEPIRPRVVEPCALCGHAREGHGIRYVALEGDHEWRDPYARSIAHTAPKPRQAPPEPETRCDCAPGEFCTKCDPWHDQHPAATPDDPARPSRFSRIANAARRAA